MSFLGDIPKSVFDRSFDAANPISSGYAFINAAASRLILSVFFGLAELPEALWNEVKSLLTPSTLWGLCIVAAAFGVAHWAAPPIALAIDALLLGYGLYELWPVVKQFGQSGLAWLSGAYNARSEQDLVAAGREFAAALATGGVTVLAAIITHKAFKSATAVLGKHYPAPAWLETKAKQVERQRARRASEESSKRRATEEASKRRMGQLASTVATPAATGAGELVDGVAIGLGVVAVVGVAAGVAAVIATSRGKNG